MLISELLISLRRKKGLNKVIRRLSTLRTWMLTLSFNILNCVYLRTKAMKNLTRNLIEEDSSQCLKISLLYTVKTKNRLAEIWDVLPKGTWAITSTNMITNMPAPDHLDELLCHLQCFFKERRKKYRSDFEPDTMSSFQNTPASHWRVNTYSALKFDRINSKICL